MKKNEEKILREYIHESFRSQSLNEGLGDVLKKGIDAALSKLSDLIGSLKRLTPASDDITSILEKNDGADVVSQIDSIGEQFESAVSDADKSIPAPKEESRARKRYKRLIEARRRQSLNEIALGGFELVGLALAAIGGVPLVLKVAAKIASLMKLKTAAAKLKDAYKSAHHFEEKIIDIAVPDKAIYAVYMMFEEKKDPDRVANLKIYNDDPEAKIEGERSMTLREFKKSSTRKKYEKRVYALILLPWVISGLVSIEHMLHSWIGMIEGAATAEKTLFVGTEVAAAVPEIASEIGTAVAVMTKIVK